MDILRNIPKGKPKSGRVWKSQKSRFSEMRLDKRLKTSWEKKMQMKAERKSVKAFEKQLKDDRNKELEDKRKRSEEKKKRRLENERKSEVVQPIKNSAKIKRMKKKQLRQIEKR
ncbi:Coiled-coil domain containing 86 [Mactra antiquata]